MAGLHRSVAPPRARVHSPLAVFAALAVVGITIAVDPVGSAPFGPARWAVTTTAVPALVAVVARRRAVRLARLPTRLFVAFVAWSGVTALAGVDPLYAWIGTPERRAGVLAWALCASAFFVGQGLRSPERRTVAHGASVAALLAGAWAFAELLGWTPLHLVGVTDRPGGPFGSSAYLGAATALLAPAAWGVALDRSTDGRARLLGLAGALLATVALLASGARAAWAGALVATLLLTARRIRRPRPRDLVRLSALAAVVVAVVLATGVAHRVPDLVRDERGGIRGRVDEWRVAGRVVAGNPVLGVGPEGYRIAFADAVDADYERRHGRAPLPDRAHSAVLDTAATTGLPGVALYLALLGALSAFALRALCQAEPWTAGLACGVLAYFVQSLVLFPIPELDVIAWLLGGMVVAGSVGSGELSDRRRRPVLGLLAAGAAVVAILAGVLDVSANRAVADDAARAARLRPDVLRYHLAAARSHEASGTSTGLDAAIDQVQRAQRVSPRDPILARERGRLLLDRARRTQGTDDIEKARRTLEDLARRDPHNAETHLRLGLAYALGGDDRKAETAWLAAERLAPRSAAASTNLAVAYARVGRLDEARLAAERALQRDPREERALHVLRTIGDADGT